MSSEEDEENGEQLDPRIRDKLEELNHWTNNINKLEKQFEETNALFRNTLNECSIRLRKLGQKLGKCVSESRPYYESKAKAMNLQMRCQSAVLRFEKSSQLHIQSKQTITNAEHKCSANNSNYNEFNTVWQEMLNQATIKFMAAEHLKKESEYEHNLCIQNYLQEEKRVNLLERQLRSAIKKSKPYYEESAKVQTELNHIKEQIERLSKTILESKKSYSKTLKDLENISEEIHEKRAQTITQSFKREPGVGAELENTNIEKRESTDEEVPQLIKGSQLNTLQVIASLSPKSLASRSPSSLSNCLSITEEDNHVLAFNPHFDNDVDNNGNTNDNDSGLEKAFVEIDLNN